MRHRVTLFTAVLTLILAAATPALAKDEACDDADACCASTPQNTNAKEAPVPAALDFTMNDIQGNPVKLSDYRGKVVLMVNVASKCGNTSQYKPLEAMYEKYKDRGFVVLGFPANDFGRQEPGTNEEVQQFCTSKYGVTFPMFAKVSVKGDDVCDLYKHLTAQDPGPGPAKAGPVTWNFEKFLLSRDGAVVARFTPKTKPDSDEVVEAVEKQLAAQ